MVLNDFLALLAQGLLIIAIPVVIVFLFQWLRQKEVEVRAHLTAQQQQFIDTGINLAVRAAEQAGLSNQLAGGGQAKKAYAVKAVQDYLDRLGIKLDVNMLTTLLEAEVNKQFSNAAPVVDDAATRSALLDKAVHAAVLAAEQSGLTGAIQNAADPKKRYAVDFAFKYLAEHGLRVDPSVVNGLIEAHVLEAKQAAQIQPTGRVKS
jgi:hypothetical protein